MYLSKSNTDVGQRLLPALGIFLAVVLVAVGTLVVRAGGRAENSVALENSPIPEVIEANDGDGTASSDVTSMTHAQRMSLFAQRLTEFRLLHRAVLVGPVHRALRPIVRGATDAECLTQAVYYEARGEPEAGQVAVAQVVVNRSRAGGRYPKSLCGVVFQGAPRPGCQFSFACEGDRQGGPINRAAWERASAVASRVMAGSAEGDLRATHYHTTAVAPLWDRSIAKLSQIGRHIFFGGRDPAPDAPAPAPSSAPAPIERPVASQS